MLSNAFESPRPALGCQGTSWLKPRCCIPTLKTVTCCCQTLQVKVMATLQGLYPKQQDQHGWAETKCRYLQCLPWFARFLGRRALVHSGRTHTGLIRTELARASISSQCELSLWATTWGLFKNFILKKSWKEYKWTFWRLAICYEIINKDLLPAWLFLFHSEDVPWAVLLTVKNTVKIALCPELWLCWVSLARWQSSAFAFPPSSSWELKE